MPSINDKLLFEEQNDCTVRLWPEGSFYKAYERSAYLFVNRVKSYEVQRRYVATAGRDVVSIGFPQSAQEKLGLTGRVCDNGSVTIRVDAPLDEQAFLSWRDALPLTEPKPKSGPAPLAAPAEPLHEQPSASSQSAAQSAEQAVAARVRSINLASTTPMQCMLLLSELQAMLNSADGK